MTDAAMQDTDEDSPRTATIEDFEELLERRMDDFKEGHDTSMARLVTIVLELKGARSGKPSNYDGITRMGRGFGNPDAARTPAPARNDGGGNAGSSTRCDKVEAPTLPPISPSTLSQHESSTLATWQANLRQANDDCAMALTYTDFDRVFRQRMQPFALTAEFLKDNKSVFESRMNATRTTDRYIFLWFRVKYTLLRARCVDKDFKLLVRDDYDIVVEVLKNLSRCELMRITLLNIKLDKHHKTPWVFPTQKDMQMWLAGAYRPVLAGLRIERTGVMRVILPLIELLHRVPKMRALFNQTDFWVCEFLQTLKQRSKCENTEALEAYRQQMEKLLKLQTVDPVRFMQQFGTPNVRIDRSRHCTSCGLAVPSTMQSAVISVDALSLTAYLATFNGIMDDFTHHCYQCNKHTAHRWTPRITIPGGQGLLVKPQPNYRLRSEDTEISIPSDKSFWVFKAAICGPGHAIWMHNDDLWHFNHEIAGISGLPCTLAINDEGAHEALSGHDMTLLYYERIAEEDGDVSDSDDGSDDDASGDDSAEAHDDGDDVGHRKKPAAKDVLVTKMNAIDLDSVLSIEVMGISSNTCITKVMVSTCIFSAANPEEQLLPTLRKDNGRDNWELVCFKLTGKKCGTLVHPFSLAPGATKLKRRKRWDRVMATLQEQYSGRCTGILRVTNKGNKAGTGGHA
ncbi:hypothetical protein FN846DRAFT_908108 [Sphaerosporella brunnea]|uniref:Uncharacterized protein n=1 Tax=Sphaerosporella brunnea TaxID=1250544 RepID=A0A5J5ETI3_9PEZI|nr:hypothetical protein FN846DRAFT_908108 [Sphaerosporella brunnea]